MERYTIKGNEFKELISLLCCVFEIRITFFNWQEKEVTDFDIEKMSSYCSEKRKQTEFHEKCVKCDTENLLLAKKHQDVWTYRCHEGLLETIVPLYDHHKKYLGALFFGQMREAGKKIPKFSSGKLKNLYSALPEYSVKQLHNIGNLIKYISEYIISNEIIKYENKHWVEKLEKYIDSHLSEKLTLKQLAQLINRSTTFISHHFPDEFGESPRQYILKKRMIRAKKLLQAGKTVYETAQELGFYDEFHFSKTFKSYWGAPPKKFKAG